MADLLVDTHCHLDLEVFDDDRDEVVNRAIGEGIAAIVVPSVDFESIPRVTALADRYEAVYAAVGIHPNDISVEMPLTDARDRLRDAAAHPKVVAIGEI